MAGLGSIDVNVTGERVNRTQAALTRIYGSIWAMYEQRLPVIMTRAKRLMIVEDAPPKPEIVTEPPLGYRASVPRMAKAKGSVAVIPVRGVIGQHRGGDY